jgi:hypothetical protein
MGFTGRSKWSCPHFLHHPANLVKLNTGHVQKCVLSLCELREKKLCSKSYGVPQSVFPQTLSDLSKRQCKKCAYNGAEFRRSCAKMRDVKVLPTLRAYKELHLRVKARNILDVKNAMTRSSLMSYKTLICAIVNVHFIFAQTFTLQVTLGHRDTKTTKQSLIV